MAFADLADVKRVLQLTTTTAAEDSQLAGALEAAEANMLSYVRQDFSASNPGTAKYYDVREDAMLSLPVEGSSVTAVRAFPGTAFNTDATPWLLTVSNDYDVEDARVVRLRPNPYTRLAPDGQWAQSRLLQHYQRVEIDYTPIGQVPADLRDATAMYAGWLWSNFPRVASGIRLEAMGDYKIQYDFSAAAESGIPPMIKSMVTAYRRKIPLVT